MRLLRTRGVVVNLLLACVLAMGLGESSTAVWVHAKARLAQFLLERAWARALDGDPAPKPWPWADTEPVARLRMVQYGVDLIVLANASGRTLAFGPAYLAGSAPPGQPGTTILTGHRDTHFSFLAKLKPSDDVTIETADRHLIRYKVREISVVDSRTTGIASDDLSRLALVTCYPFDAVMPGGPMRYVVTADLVGW